MAKLSLLFGVLSLVAQTIAVVSSGQVQPNSTVSVPKTNKKGNGILQLPVTKVKKPLSARSRIYPYDKRQVVNTKAQNFYGALYLIDVPIGSNGQTVSLQIDTGSSDTWVNPNCSNSAWAAYCNTGARYNPSTSTTSVNLGTTMKLGYGAGSVDGIYYTDSMTIGGSKITAQQFGVATTSSYIYTGIMGIGFGKGLCTNYYNVIDQLAAQGLISSRAFSLDLGAINTAAGSLTFGGIDSGKFSGTLSKSPIIPYQSAPEKFPRYWVTLNGVGSTRNSSGTLTSTTATSAGYSLGVILDSGTTMSSLPSALVNGMLAGISGAVQISSGQYTVPCSLMNEAGASMDFTFGTNVIRVPFSQFMWNNGGTCYFGAVASESVDAILGDTFLRGTYTVFDQDNMNIWMANSASCGSALTTIGSGANAITSMVGQCASPRTATPSASSSSTSSTTSKTSTSTTSSSSSSSSKSSSSSAAGQSSSTTTSSKSTSTTSTSSAGQTSSSTKPTTVSATPSTSYQSTIKIGDATSSKSTAVSTTSSLMTTFRIGAVASSSTSTSVSSTSSSKSSSSTSSTKSSSSANYITITVTETRTQAPVTMWSTTTMTRTVYVNRGWGY